MRAWVFLALAARHRITATTVPYAFEHADQALTDLAHGRFSGAAVLHVGDRGAQPRTALGTR